MLMEIGFIFLITLVLYVLFSVKPLGDNKKSKRDEFENSTSDEGGNGWWDNSGSGGSDWDILSSGSGSPNDSID